MTRASSSQTSQRLRVPVSARGVVARVNRLLARKRQELRKTRGVAIETLGRFYITDGIGVVSHHVDLEQFARQSGALEAYEHLIED